MPYPADFLDQIELGWNASFSGWDFSWLNPRRREDAPPWDYRALALERMRAAHTMLDMDTGGGEFLASLAPFPPDTRATEGYPPNIPLAKARLEPLGVPVFEFTEEAHLPFEDAAFDLVINRHGGYNGPELQRILKPGGIFLTQQVGGLNEIRLNELLQDEVHAEYDYHTLDYAAGLLVNAGMELLQAREDFPVSEFYDLAGVVYYLRVISWQVPGFTPEAYLERLYGIYEMIKRDGKLSTPSHRLLLEARRRND